MTPVLNRLDAPTDYQALWRRLHERLDELATDYAARCATATSWEDTLRCQGSYQMTGVVNAEMERLLSLARAARG